MRAEPSHVARGLGEHPVGLFADRPDRRISAPLLKLLARCRVCLSNGHGRAPPAGMSDHTEFAAFVGEYQDMVFATAVRLLGRQADAEDVAQSVFLKAFERFDQVRASPTAAGWLKTVTMRMCFNHLARYRRRWRFFSEVEGSVDHAPVDVESAHEALERADRDASLERAVRRLPDAQRVPLVLFHVEGLTYQEIAVALGASLGKVKTDIHRGREALRKELSFDAGFR